MSKRSSVDVDILLSNIQKKFNLSKKEAMDLAREREEEISIPVSIFSPDLGMLESISLYLKDEVGLSFNDIAKLLKRDYKTIWTSYDKAKKKRGKHVKR